MTLTRPTARRICGTAALTLWAAGSGLAVGNNLPALDPMLVLGFAIAASAPTWAWIVSLADRAEAGDVGTAIARAVQLGGQINGDQLGQRRDRV